MQKNENICQSMPKNSNKSAFIFQKNAEICNLHAEICKNMPFIPTEISNLYVHICIYMQTSANQGLII